MKNVKIFIALSILSTMVIIMSLKKRNYSQKYYYAFDEKININEDFNKIVLTFDTILTKTQFDILINSVSSSCKKSISGNSMIIETNSAIISDALIEKFKSNAHLKKANKMYIDENNFEVGITNELLLKFKEGTTQKEKEKLILSHSVKVLNISNNIYKLEVRSMQDDVLEIANQFQETGLVVYSHPNFLLKRVYCNYIPNDSYFQKQFYLYNTGQVINDGRAGTAGADIKATEAWNITKGSSNITIAVLDMGVTSNHPDLPNSRQVRLSGSNYYGANPNDPSPNNPIDFHGDASAGIIAATQDNNEGISGIAPNCKIMPINTGGLDITYVNASVLSSAIEFARANGADIIYNGWSTTGAEPNQVPAIVDAISTATSTGRGGKGCVVICVPINGAGYVSFPANVEVSGVLSVGASDRNDQVATYSPWCRGGFSSPYPMFGQLIDIVAPSHKGYSANETLEVWSMDNPAANGTNPYPSDGRFFHPPSSGEQLPNSGTNYLAYTGRFGGTSAAGPQVAGVAALMLSLNSNLTQQQVFDILISTADKVGGYDYNYYINHPNTSYYADYGRSREMGYGRLNTCKAVTEVLKTLSLNISGDNNFCTNSNSFTIPNISTGVNISWSANPNGIVSINSPNGLQTTLTKIGNGLITLTATISNACGSSFSISKPNIEVGTPQYSYEIIPSPISSYTTCHKLNKTYSFTAQPAGNEPYYQTRQFSWVLNDLDNYNPTVLNSTSKTVSFEFPYEGNFQLTVRPKNSCGVGGPLSIYEEELYASSYCSGGGGYYKVVASPNPTRNNLNVEIKDMSVETEKLVANERTLYQLYNFNQTHLVKQWAFDGIQKKQNLNVVGLTKGQYVLVVSIGKFREATHIIIR